MRTAVRRLLALSTALACAALTGCAAPRPPLYAWNDYQPQVYQYLKDDGSTAAEDQLLRLEENQQKVLGEGKALPPGYRAHMALLYSKTGNNEKTVQQLAEEKVHFPESAIFMDTLLQSFTVPSKH
ncbi:MAG: DUF4810 domain-containing protein [Burkholderiaceae bacterium]|nr:DUF4810 domain-containing protein [Burkholderiaceae bacterium]